MRIPHSLTAGMLTIIFVSACASNTESPVESPSTWSSDMDRILAATEASAEAWNRGDLKGHLSIYVDTVTFMTPTGPRPGVAATEEAFRRTYFSEEMPQQRLEFDELSVSSLGDDAALQTGRFTLIGGGQAEQSGWFTLVWMRTSDGWKAVHDHSS